MTTTRIVKCEWVDRNPNMNDMPRGSRHFKVTLGRGRKRMTLYWSQGPAIEREPDAESIMECLEMDASTADSCGSFDDWCAELGFDADSRKAEALYRRVNRQAERFARFIAD